MKHNIVFYHFNSKYISKLLQWWHGNRKKCKRPFLTRSFPFRHLSMFLISDQKSIWYEFQTRKMLDNLVRVFQVATECLTFQEKIFSLRETINSEWKFPSWRWPFLRSLIQFSDFIKGFPNFKRNTTCGISTNAF